MNFLNVGPWELTVILIIAILLIGPQRMIELARAIGRVTSQLRRMSNEFTATIQAELRATEREVRQALEHTVEKKPEPIASIQAELQATERETRQALENVVKDEAGSRAG